MRRICRGEATTVRAVVPLDVRHQLHRGLVPRHRPQRVEVGLHREVAVAARPRRHLVALHRLHVHVHGEEVVAALGAVLGHVVQEVLAVSRLPWSRPSMSAIVEQDGVHGAVLDRLLELVELHLALALRAWLGRPGFLRGRSYSSMPLSSASRRVCP